MIEKKLFKSLLTGAFTTGGFEKKGKELIRDGRDSIQVIEFQKSDYDEKYYINFGIWLKRLGSPERLIVRRCHMYFRLEAIVRDEFKAIEEGGRIDATSLAPLEKLVELIGSRFIPFSTECLDEAMIRKHYAMGRLTGGLIRLEARKVLE